MTTSVPPPPGGQQHLDLGLTLLPVGSPASRSRPPAGAVVSPTSGGAGRGWQTSFAWYDPATSWWRTSQVCLPTETLSAGSSPTWPRSGSMRAGACSPHAPWVPHTHGNACSSWPTPTAAMGARGWGLGKGGRYRAATEEPDPWPDPIHGFLAADTAGHRVADGLPARVDQPRTSRRDRSRLDAHRVTALGNAVVPAVAEYLGHHLTTHAARHAAAGNPALRKVS